MSDIPQLRNENWNPTFGQSLLEISACHQTFLWNARKI